MLLQPKFLQSNIPAFTAWVMQTARLKTSQAGYYISSYETRQCTSAIQPDANSSKKFQVSTNTCSFTGACRHVFSGLQQMGQSINVSTIPHAFQLLLMKSRQSSLNVGAGGHAGAWHATNAPPEHLLQCQYKLSIRPSSPIYGMHRNEKGLLDMQMQCEGKSVYLGSTMSAGKAIRLQNRHQYRCHSAARVCIANQEEAYINFDPQRH